jgi:putative ABC transport system substrate-binding protein
MKRREFLGVLGGAVAANALPRAARAQQSAMPVIGYLNSTSLAANANRLRAFRQGLKETGHVEGENVAIEYRWAENQMDRLPALAAELVRRQVAVIATAGVVTTLAAKAATTTIPIVFTVGDDPVRTGLVTSLARPGGNLIGINFLNSELAAKRLKLLRELVPGAVRLAVLVNPTNTSNTELTLRDVEAAARAMGLKIRVLRASNSREIDAAFATFVDERPDALFVGPDPFLTSRRVQLVQLAARNAIPATYNSRENAEAGGLMSYGADISDAWRQVGGYAGRVLKGEKPHAGRAVDQVRACDQPSGGQDTWPHRVAVTARPRRRSDRISSVDDRFWQIVLQKSFCTGDQNFCGLQAQISGKDVRDLVALR